MVFCKHARTKRDDCGQLEFYCTHFRWRMDMELLDRCASCSEYKSM